MSRPAKGSAKLVPKPVRLTEGDHKRVQRASQSCGMSPAEFRRWAIMEAVEDLEEDAIFPHPSEVNK